MILLIFFVIIGISISYVLSHSSTQSASLNARLLKQGYSEAEIQQFTQALTTDQILELSTKDYQAYALERLIYPHFAEWVDLGYQASEALELLPLSDDQRMFLVQLGHVDQILTWLDTDYFIFDRLPRYLEKAKSYSEVDFRKVVELVNTDRDYEQYTHTKSVDLSQKLILVNKYYQLSKTSVPIDLSQAEGCGKPKLTKAASAAYDLMCQAILKDGINLVQRSSYRSYDYQKTLYDNYVKQDTKALADTYSARPGFSEHQTGLAVDVNEASYTFDTFETSASYRWLIKNAYKYGFILRYPSDKTDITGYQFESWHYRYVGIETALAIKTLGITLDEYWLWQQQ